MDRGRDIVRVNVGCQRFTATLDGRLLLCKTGFPSRGGSVVVKSRSRWQGGERRIRQSRIQEGETLCTDVIDDIPQGVGLVVYSRRAPLPFSFALTFK
jgi:hypothetical protein